MKKKKEEEEKFGKVSCTKRGWEFLKNGVESRKPNGGVELHLELE